MLTEATRRHIAQHEAAHALAYLVNDLSVEFLDADEGLTHGDSSLTRLITFEAHAQISMAGPGFEIGERVLKHGPDEAMRLTLESWHETATQALEDRENYENDDLLSVGESLFKYVTWAYAFASVNRDLIIEVGDLAIARGGRLLGADFMPQFQDRVQAVPDEDRWAAEELFLPHLDQILEVEHVLDAWRLAVASIRD